ncbi:MAG: lipopolysaccharide biosynthesis protein [Lachnoclostridium sp.]|nr:lipopolysaccharide biosynthesis protein [Lachnoclostridium sp.]
MSEPSDNLKLGVARTIKWNVIDRVASQILYAVTGIVLANVLSREEFGLVGMILVIQAFASLFVDSGFSSALIQAKAPSRRDYSTVLWFNLAMATMLYIILFLAAPLMPDIFKADHRIVSLSRVMFLTFIINASAIVQTNILMKKMDVKMIAVSNSIGLIVSAVVGIALALGGFGAWALVWQSITLAAIKSGILWLTCGWTPEFYFSGESLGRFFKVGSGVMISSFLNTVFVNIAPFFIGNRVGMTAMGYYSQADKWSKMPSASLSQVLTSSFLPALTKVRDDESRFHASLAKMNRFTSYLVFPAMGLLVVLAEPIFHFLFRTKWDGAIPLFQILCLRGIFTVFISLYNNFILTLGRSKLLIYTEIARDVAAIAAIVVTLPYITLSTETEVTLGLKIFLWGQLVASAVTWALTLWLTARVTGHHVRYFIIEMTPYLVLSALAMTATLSCTLIDTTNLLRIIAGLAAGALIYLGVSYLLGSKIQRDVLEYITGPRDRRQ